MTRRCWTCNQEHDLDEACTSAAMPSGPANLFEDATGAPAFGPVFTAMRETDDACCGDGIVPGENIRADGQGCWIHADTTCERLASR